MLVVYCLYFNCTDAVRVLYRARGEDVPVRYRVPSQSTAYFVEADGEEWDFLKIRLTKIEIR